LCIAFWEGSYYNYNIVFNYYYALMMVKELDVSGGWLAGHFFILSAILPAGTIKEKVKAGILRGVG